MLSIEPPYLTLLTAGGTLETVDGVAEAKCCRDLIGKVLHDRD